VLTKDPHSPDQAKALDATALKHNIRLRHGPRLLRSLTRRGRNGDAIAAAGGYGRIS
jgi:hypothetical protein